MRNLTILTTVGMSAIMACTPAPNKAGALNHNASDDMTGEIIVDAKDNVSASDIDELSDIAGTTLYANNDVAREYKYEVGKVDLANEDTILARLNADPRVEHAEKMITMHALYTPNDEMYPQQYGLTRMGLESSYGMSCGMGVKVAVIDTGVQCNLTDLAGVSCGGGYNFVDNNDNTMDGNMHGSHVAGTIAEATDNKIGGAGMAHCVSLMPVKVLSDTGNGSSEGVAEGIRYAADHGANVINMSLGSDSPSDVIKDAVKYAHDKGVVVVCAAGNSGGSVGYPAAYPESIAVSAIDKNDNIANFSSRGKEVAIAAPGVNILQQTISRVVWPGNGGSRGSPEGSYEALSGTSMASPMIAGEAALIVASGISNPDAVKARIQSTADPKDEPNLYGAGIGRADSAIRSTLLSHFFIRALALLGLIFLVRKGIKTELVKSKLSMLGIVFSGFGLVPLFFVGLLPHMGSMRILGELAARPFGEWNMVLGFAQQYLPFAAMPVLPGIATLLLLNSRARALAGGLSIGSAALCTQMLYSNDVNYFMGSIMMRVVLGVSVVVCLWLAQAAFDKSTK